MDSMGSRAKEQKVRGRQDSLWVGRRWLLCNKLGRKDTQIVATISWDLNEILMHWSHLIPDPICNNYIFISYRIIICLDIFYMYIYIYIVLVYVSFCVSVCNVCMVLYMHKTWMHTMYFKKIKIYTNIQIVLHSLLLLVMVKFSFK